MRKITMEQGKRRIKTTEEDETKRRKVIMWSKRMDEIWCMEDKDAVGHFDSIVAHFRQIFVCFRHVIGIAFPVPGFREVGGEGWEEEECEGWRIMEDWDERRS